MCLSDKHRDCGASAMLLFLYFRELGKEAMVGWRGSVDSL